MTRVIDKIPNKLNQENIEEAICNYLNLLQNIPLKIRSESILGFLTDLKRKEMNSGPYPKVTLFEAANRIMSDLIILYGVRKLLNGAIPEINYKEYQVEFGNDNKNDNDIFATDGTSKLIGEGFNVAKTFFQTKKASALKKMRAKKNQSDKLILIYNSDAVLDNYSPTRLNNEYHLKIDLKV